MENGSELEVDMNQMQRPMVTTHTDVTHYLAILLFLDLELSNLVVNSMEPVASAMLNTSIYSKN